MDTDAERTKAPRSLEKSTSTNKNERGVINDSNETMNESRNDRQDYGNKSY